MARANSVMPRFWAGDHTQTGEMYVKGTMETIVQQWPNSYISRRKDFSITLSMQCLKH